MGFFDRFTGRKPAPASTPSPAPAQAPDAAAPKADADAGDSPAPDAAAAAGPGTAAGAGASVKARLAAAREKLAAKDLPGALAIYEELLASAGDRADVLVAVSGDLGSHGHVEPIIELIAPRYDAERHGPATGLNLLQAYLAVRNADAAQHVLDILFELDRPELEERLHGFSNAIAELIATPHAAPSSPLNGAPAGEIPNVALISISKPMWFYGLEPLAAQILPPKEARLRRIAFAQLALPGYPEIAEAMKKPEDELGRLSRAIPLWLTETFYFSALYIPQTALGVLTPSDGTAARHVIFGAEWTTENLRQLVDTSSEPVDYVVTGALRAQSGDYELQLRVWQVKSFREIKKFQARWTPATADAALQQLHADFRAYAEWSPTSAAYTYSPPAQPRAWLETLGAAAGLFLVEKNILPPASLPPVLPDLERAAQAAASSEATALAFLTLRARAKQLGLLPSPIDAALARSPLVAQAQKLLG